MTSLHPPLPPPAGAPRFPLSRHLLPPPRRRTAAPHLLVPSSTSSQFPALPSIRRRIVPPPSKRLRPLHPPPHPPSSASSGPSSVATTVLQRLIRPSVALRPDPPPHCHRLHRNRIHGVPLRRALNATPLRVARVRNHRPLQAARRHSTSSVDFRLALIFPHRDASAPSIHARRAPGAAYAANTLPAPSRPHLFMPASGHTHPPPTSLHNNNCDSSPLSFAPPSPILPAAAPVCAPVADLCARLVPAIRLCQSCQPPHRFARPGEISYCLISPAATAPPPLAGVLLPCLRCRRRSSCPFSLTRWFAGLFWSR